MQQSRCELRHQAGLTEEYSHIQLDSRVFTEGPDWKKEKWISGLAEELSTMFEGKEALVKLEARLGMRSHGHCDGFPKR